MQITTFRPEEYRGCPIYYRTFKKHFEYLVVVHNQIYTAHFEVRPTLIGRILCIVGVEKLNYSEQLQKKILAQARKMAETTIDYILDKK